MSTGNPVRDRRPSWPRSVANRARRLNSAEGRWRLAGILLVAAYVAQYAFGLRWEWLYRLQSVDEFKYATGICLILYIGWQWYLFLARLNRKRLWRILAFHERSGVVAPVIFYIHSVQIGYGYLAALGWIFLTGVIIGLANPLGLNVRRRYYTAGWMALHVAVAALTLILGLYHAYIAFYYK